jgi:hypothetical protein
MQYSAGRRVVLVDPYNTSQLCEPSVADWCPKTQMCAGIRASAAQKWTGITTLLLPFCSGERQVAHKGTPL